MTIDKAIYWQDKATNAIIGVFSEAEERGFTHDYMLTLLNERLESIRKQKLPRWLSSSIFAQINIMFRAQYCGPNPKVVWRHVFEGQLYANWNALPEAGKELGRQNKLVSGHFWADTLQPFSVTSEAKL